MIGNQTDPEYKVGELIHLTQLFDRNELLIYDDTDHSNSILKSFKTGRVTYEFVEFELPELNITVKCYDHHHFEENHDGKYTLLIHQYKLDFVYEVGSTI
jgi:hypothetical protein